MKKHELMDDDGENRAVRAFLLGYKFENLTVGAMKKHLELSGYPYAPNWVTDYSNQYLTKSGTQLWLRLLFDLEKELEE